MHIQHGKRQCWVFSDATEEYSEPLRDEEAYAMFFIDLLSLLLVIVLCMLGAQGGETDWHFAPGLETDPRLIMQLNTWSINPLETSQNSSKKVPRFNTPTLCL